MARKKTKRHRGIAPASGQPTSASEVIAALLDGRAVKIGGETWRLSASHSAMVTSGQREVPIAVFRLMVRYQSYKII